MISMKGISAFYLFRRLGWIPLERTWYDFKQFKHFIGYKTWNDAVLSIAFARYLNEELPEDGVVLPIRMKGKRPVKMGGTMRVRLIP